MELRETKIDRPQRDRRRTVRARCRAVAELQRVDHAFSGDCGDLSLGGMLFIGPLLPLGHGVDVVIELPGLGSFCIQGEVVGHRRCRGRPSMAIRFISLAQRDLNAISHFVSERAIEAE